MMDSTGTIYSLANASHQSSSNSEQSGFCIQNSSLALIEHLQINLRQEQERRLELEKEVSNLQKRTAELERLVAEKSEALARSADVQEAQLASIKHRLMRTVRHVTGASSCDPRSSSERVQFVHQCDQCQFATRSEVSLILHKINHGIREQHFSLSTQHFTTRNSNSKSIYDCPACDEGASLTRHEVYRHIYENHTNEKPLVCPFCELSFTHKDYIDEHIREKHAKLPFSSTTNNAIRFACTDQVAPKEALAGASANLLSTSAVPSDNSSRRTSGQQLRGRASSSSQPSTPSSTTVNSKRSSSQKELRCTFLDCNFVTLFPDKLEFHMKAHVNTKYKCPYCPYVSNTIADIKRHIQKSKKHEGMKMYSCQKCGFGADCDRVFKEHLRVYHFGYEVHDTVIDYFIEEMFSNKNKRSDDEETVAVAGTVLDPGTPPPAKKLASNALGGAQVSTTPKMATTASPFKLSTMIEEQQQQSSSSHPQASLADALSAQNLSNSYRVVHHSLNLQNSTPLSMYHELAGSVDGHHQAGSGQFGQQQQHHHHHHSLASLPLNMATSHHNSQTNRANTPNVNEPTALLAENFAHTLNSTNNTGNSGGEHPVSLQQYVTYANY